MAIGVCSVLDLIVQTHDFLSGLKLKIPGYRYHTCTMVPVGNEVNSSLFSARAWHALSFEL